MTIDGMGQEQEPLRALPISPGIALGPVRLLDIANQRVTRETIHDGQLAGERQRLQRALTAAGHELDDLHTQVKHTIGEAEAEIFAAQKLMVNDPELLDAVEVAMANQLFSAEAAWNQAIEQVSAELAALGDTTLAARALDVRDVGARVLRHLQTDLDNRQPQNEPEQPAIIVARDLTPSQTAGLSPASILGICTVEGGPTTHAAIIARALEIPAVAGLDEQVLLTLINGEELALDGERGLVYLQPQGTRRALLQAAMKSQQNERLGRRQQDAVRWRTRPGESADGQHVLIYANVGDADGAREAGNGGAEGIGLLRTEFLFGQRTTFPNEQEQFEGYIEVFRAFAEQARFRRTIVARTLDAGADKPFPALEPLLGSWKEANPALGLRGARIHVLHEDLLRQQLRALLRAAGETNIHLHIMFPMIATLEETRKMKRVLEKAREELASSGTHLVQDIQIGVMIETPAAVWMADALAREVDFFSLGANDLFQYTMAADRTNSRVMSLFGSLEPALWRTIAHVVQVGRASGRMVAVCGEIAADPRYGPLLVGLGVQELSVSPPALSRIKAALNQRPIWAWQKRAQAMLYAETAEAMEEIVASE